MRTLLTIVGIVLLTSSALPVCVDRDHKVKKYAERHNIEGVTGCGDLQRYCDVSGREGTLVRRTCCETCKSLLPEPATMDPVHLFLLAGQSECVGQASVNMLQEDETYAELAGSQSGVWLTHKHSSENRITISKMQAGNSSPNSFGPEISFGHRVREITGARVIVVKYCWGGSNVRRHWNPDSPDNSWDYASDDGTSEWLEANGVVDFENKNSLFANLVYTARVATERLEAKGVPYEWKSIVWVQGAGDSSDTWQNIGSNTARLFDAIRERAVGVLDLPVVDSGGGGNHRLNTGKAYARQLVKACRVTSVDFIFGVSEPNSSCVNTASSICEDTILNVDLFNHYGWEIAAPEDVLPPGATSKKFHWFKKYPINQHSEYEGMVLKGRMLANAYVREFTNIAVPPAMEAQDPWALFPLPRCEPGIEPTPTALCWIDERSEEQAAEVCLPAVTAATATHGQQSTSISTNSGSSARASSLLNQQLGAQGSMANDLKRVLLNAWNKLRSMGKV